MPFVHLSFHPRSVLVQTSVYLPFLHCTTMAPEVGSSAHAGTGMLSGRCTTDRVHLGRLENKDPVLALFQDRGSRGGSLGPALQRSAVSFLEYTSPTHLSFYSEMG